MASPVMQGHLAHLFLHLDRAFEKIEIPRGDIFSQGNHFAFQSGSVSGTPRPYIPHSGGRFPRSRSTRAPAKYVKHFPSFRSPTVTQQRKLQKKEKPSLEAQS